MAPIILIIVVIATVVYFLKNSKADTPKEFPDEWRPLLEKWVSFYKNLDTDKRRVFENDMMRFLSYVKITPVKCELEALDYILVSASAVIPLFHFPEWVYPNINEVLLYPNSFNREFELQGEGRNMLGLVGQTGHLRDKMILSKRSLINGFQQKDKSNVGIHEFIHLLDMADGKIDGVPQVILQKPYILPWLKLMRTEMKNIQDGDSSIRAYGATNEAEYFSVVSEYFFGQPRLLKKKHPELYSLLSKMYGYGR